jgi:predicted membrane protein
MQMAETVKMKNKDKSRKWMWWFLGSIVALQAYFVRELLAAFVLFALGFAAIAMVIGSLYMLHKTWALAVERLANSQHPAMVAARHGMDTVEDELGSAAMRQKEKANRPERAAGLFPLVWSY